MSNVDDIGANSSPTEMSDDDFEIVNHCSSSASENITDLLHSLSDETTRVEILNNLDKLVNENKRTKELLEQTYQTLRDREFNEMKWQIKHNQLEEEYKNTIKKLQNEEGTNYRLDAEKKEYIVEINSLKSKLNDLGTQLENEHSDSIEILSMNESLKVQLEKLKREKLDLMGLYSDLLLQYNHTNSLPKEYSLLEDGDCSSLESQKNIQETSIGQEKGKLANTDTQIELLVKRTEEGENLCNLKQEEIESLTLQLLDMRERVEVADQTIKDMTQQCNIKIEKWKHDVEKQEALMNDQISAFSLQKQDCVNRADRMAIEISEKDDDLARKDSQICKLQDDLGKMKLLEIDLQGQLKQLQVHSEVWEQEAKTLRDHVEVLSSSYPNSHQHFVRECDGSTPSQPFPPVGGIDEVDILPQNYYNHAGEDLKNCPVCDLSLQDKDETAKQLHLNKCFDSQETDARNEANFHIH